MKPEIKFKQTCFLLLPLVIAQVGVAQMPQLLAAQGAIAPPQVPNNLKVPPNQVLLLGERATGVQIYECKAKSGNANQFEWTFVAPEAKLLGEQDNNNIKHYAGPTWEANDGSKVVGQVKASFDSPSPNAIPWLLLQAKSHEGNGILSKVTYIQRVDTVGGKPPVQGCDRKSVGTQKRVNYTSDYFFYGTAP
ncbi:hypothetical protein SAMD00079811_27420 [Scytonema sp. HK-05]|uniref:DUF3455 domain-containing protein n=1 Tax=Scytonema sp. HK-05 TaxID=1137095 RepID=UPI000A5C9FB5|nr:DUF3455 domain-containing protein [Scytonema sp. HK-05]BAY45140.1 hypothetical protein SAMD00079811_27420 [Scytonema sp. HK-05]